MANLAIKGHATRGREVIALLKMLGGKNDRMAFGNIAVASYFIDKENKIVYDFMLEENNNYIIFTLEQFEEEFPYKVGEKVCYQPNPQIDAICISKIVAMRWLNNSVIYTTSNAHELYACDLQPYKEETMEEIYINKIGFNDDKARLILPNGYEFKAEGNEVFVIKKKPRYPKTYKKCCEVIEYKITGDTIIGYNCGVLRGFQQLLICRDAYWKIAGEEMGLNEPWKPDWKDKEQIKFVIIVQKENIQRYEYMFHKILVFPTKEMRDTFYENFKDLIEQCEELL